MEQNILPLELQEEYLRIIEDAQAVSEDQQKAESHPVDQFLTGTVLRIPILIWMAWMSHNIGIFLAGGQNTPFLSYLLAFLFSVWFAKFFWETKIVPRLVKRRSRLVNERKAKNDSAMRLWWKDVAELLRQKGWGTMCVPENATVTDGTSRMFGWNGDLWTVQPLLNGTDVWLVDHRGHLVSPAPAPSPSTSRRDRRNKDRI